MFAFVSFLSRLQLFFLPYSTVWYPILSCWAHSTIPLQAFLQKNKQIEEKPNCRLQYTSKQTRGNLKSPAACMGQDLSLSVRFLLTSAHIHLFFMCSYCSTGKSLYFNAINGFHIGSARFIHYTDCSASHQWIMKCGYHWFHLPDFRMI